MKFCPDEQDLVLEIFKQLGSGNAIKDVPVRFRTKDGRIVDLLIDSNVKYDTDACGNSKFGHTRCFIRDDTKRKIREANTQTLLEEMKRSFQMLDNFMSRSIHHLRTPLHVMQNTCELVTELLENPTTDGAVLKESITLLGEAETRIGEAVGLADDLVQLGRLDQGAELQLEKAVVDLVTLGDEMYKCMLFAGDSLVSLDIQGGGGPSKIHSDPAVLRRILRALLEHATNVNAHGEVKLQIGYQNGLCTFEVLYSEKDSIPSQSTKDQPYGELPPIFQRYQQKFIPEGNVDLETATSLREEIECHINSCKDNSIGIGLSLAYYLVQGLGSDLRYSSEQSGTAKFWFSLPKDDLPNGEKCSDLFPMKLQSKQNKNISSQTDPESVLPDSTSPTGPSIAVLHAKQLPNAPGLKLKEETPIEFSVSKSKIASEGLTSMDPPHVLIVEDTHMCAKLLRMSLSKLNCSTTTVDNGRLAVEKLRKAAPGEYSLVLMDLRMPEMDGLEATKILKQELNLTIPIVALTAETTPSIQAECAAIGFDDFRSKPLKRDHLKEILLQHTGYHVL